MPYGDSRDHAIIMFINYEWSIILENLTKKFVDATNIEKINLREWGSVKY